MNDIRVAVVTSDSGPEAQRRVQAYMPRGYNAFLAPDDDVIIIGRDIAGWTLDGYVLPRLASGLIAAKEYEDYFLA